MSYWETFLLAIRSIACNKMRAFLTMLGIIIGVAAVVMITGLGHGMDNYMRDQFSSLGTNTLTVTITKQDSTYLSIDDMYKVVSNNYNYLRQISPTVVVEGGVKVGSNSYNASSVLGVGESFFEMKGYEVIAGRGLQYMDIHDRKAVCVVGDYVNNRYYAGDAVGQTIRIGGNKIRIVGVIGAISKESEKGGADDYVYLPYSTANRISHNGIISNYTITIWNEEQASTAKNIVEKALHEMIRDTNGYTVISMTEVLAVMTRMTNTAIMVLTIVAAISLIVGGIGIMNIMLVSVTERTREIGIRKALGAKESTILRQFIMEAAVTSAIGGIIGVILGFLLCVLASRIIQSVMDTPLIVSPTAPSVMLAFSVSAGIGLLFGWLPARKAASLNPIDALHYE